MWAKRVAEWKASGLTSESYCEGKPFTAGGLRHWSHRLREREQPAPVRMARVVRISELKSPGPAGRTPSGVAPDLVVEIGTARIAVRPGFDRATLADVVEVLATSARSAR